MFCSSKYCYVCLTERNNLKSINNIDSTTVLLEKLAYCSHNVKWTKRINCVVICEECYGKLHIAYDFLIMCHKNSMRLQSQLEHTTGIKNAEIDLNVTLYDIKKAELNVEYNTNIDIKNTSTYKTELTGESSTNICDNSRQIQDVLNTVEVENTSAIQCVKNIGDKQIDNSYDYSLRMKIKDEIISDDETLVEDPLQLDGEVNSELPTLPSDNNESNITSIEYDCIGFTSNEIRVSQEYSADVKHETTELQTDTYEKTENINSDMSTNTNKIRFQCSVCSKYYTGKTGLSRHQVIHTGKKPYKCSICDKSFGRKRVLKNHEIIHTDEKPFQCILCSKSFNQKITLEVHSRTHTGEKPYKCTFCGKCFAYKSDVNRHQRIHTGVKPFACALCSKCFTDKSNLNNHMLIHTRNKSV